MKKVIIQESKTIFDDFFKIEEAQVRFEQFDGQLSPLVRRLNFERGDSVAALIYNPATQHIILVNQFKYPTFKKGPGWMTETTAGMIGKDESAEAAVRREVLEETGYEVTSLELISTFYVSPGGSSERIILYYTEVDDKSKIGAGGGVASENENIINVKLTLEGALGQIDSGEIVDAKTILGIFWLQNRLRQNAQKKSESRT
jgi:nudix-type nucleoside diphosphatase (YffH/AdpP family)